MYTYTVYTRIYVCVYVYIYIYAEYIYVYMYIYMVVSANIQYSIVSANRGTEHPVRTTMMTAAGSAC